MSDSLEQEYRSSKAVTPNSGDVATERGPRERRKTPLFRALESRYFLWAAALTAVGLMVAGLIVVFMIW